MLGTMYSGGDILGQGMYGCVFTSSLHCKNPKNKIIEAPEDKEHPPVSKLIEQSQADIEFTISNLIRQIPLWKNYFAVSESICEPATKQSEKDLDHCEVLEDKPLSDFRILSMTYHGVPLDGYKFNLSTFEPMKFFSHLIEAGALMALYGVVHRDLHRGNILIDRHNVPRIIDFNLSVLSKEDVTDNDLLHRHTVTLGQEPPDATIVNAVAQGYDGMSVIDSILTKKRVLGSIQILLGESPQKMKTSLYRFYQQSKSMKDGDIEAWFKMYWRVYDSWGIGVNIVVMLMTFARMPSFSMDPFRTKLFPILRKMCAVNPLERIDCVQALYQLDPNHFIITRYAKAWLNKVGYGN